MRLEGRAYHCGVDKRARRMDLLLLNSGAKFEHYSKVSNNRPGTTPRASESIAGNGGQGAKNVGLKKGNATREVVVQSNARVWSDEAYGRARYARVGRACCG